MDPIGNILFKPSVWPLFVLAKNVPRIAGVYIMQKNEKGGGGHSGKIKNLVKKIKGVEKKEKTASKRGKRLKNCIFLSYNSYTFLSLEPPAAFFLRRGKNES